MEALDRYITLDFIYRASPIVVGRTGNGRDCERRVHRGEMKWPTNAELFVRKNNKTFENNKNAESCANGMLACSSRARRRMQNALVETIVQQLKVCWTIFPLNGVRCMSGQVAHMPVHLSMSAHFRSGTCKSLICTACRAGGRSCVRVCWVRQQFASPTQYDY